MRAVVPPAQTGRRLVTGDPILLAGSAVGNRMFGPLETG
jgi:hypothetical protein